MSMQVMLSLAAMALTTYLIRVIPMVLFRKPIENAFVQSFLYYVPYAVLSAMTFPAILLSDLPLAAGAAGLLAGLLCAWKGHSLLSVAAATAAAAWIVSVFL